MMSSSTWQGPNFYLLAPGSLYTTVAEMLICDVFPYNAYVITDIPYNMVASILPDLRF